MHSPETAAAIYATPVDWGSNPQPLHWRAKAEKITRIKTFVPLRGSFDLNDLNGNRTRDAALKEKS